MAVLQKIRDKNILLVSIVALALLLFVIQGVFSGNFLFGSNSQTAGTVNGEELSIQDYQKMVQDYQNFFEITQPNQDFKSEEASNRVHDIAWSNYVMNTIIESECEKVGLAVTDAEVQEILRTGKSQFLQSPYFMNKETGQYDPTAIPMFLSQYEEFKKSGQPINDEFEKIHKYILFVEEQLKHEALQNKFQNLLSLCLISNSVEAKNSFDGRTLVKNIQVAYIPFSSIDDSQIKVSDEEIKSRFEQNKAKYFSLYAIRDAKMLNIQVLPSDADKKAIESDFNKYYTELDSTNNINDIIQIVRNSGSEVQFTDLYKSDKAFPVYIKKMLTSTDSTSLSIGKTSKPALDLASNKYYTVKLIDKITQVDSVLYRSIPVSGENENEKTERADSIFNALKNGGNYSDIAKLYNIPSDSMWISTSQYENGTITNKDEINLINTLFTSGVGIQKLKLQNGNYMIIQILESKNPITKYKVASIEKQFLFSEQTYNDYFNKISEFISKNKTLSEIEANASKNGYTVQEIAVQSNDHQIAGIRGTQDALRWLFDEAEVGEISQIYRCGTNDHFMILSLTGINNGTMSEKMIKDIIRTEIINEKKSEQIMKRLGNVKTMDAAKGVDGVIFQDSVSTTSQMPAFIGTAQEPIVSMMASITPVNKFCGPFKGNQGVYMLQVVSENRSEDKFDLFKESQQAQAVNVRRTFGSLFDTLSKTAKIEDYRYKFNM